MIEDRPCCDNCILFDEAMFKCRKSVPKTMAPSEKQSVMWPTVPREAWCSGHPFVEEHLNAKEWKIETENPGSKLVVIDQYWKGYLSMVKACRLFFETKPKDAGAVPDDQDRR